MINTLPVMQVEELYVVDLGVITALPPPEALPLPEVVEGAPALKLVAA